MTRTATQKERTTDSFSAAATAYDKYATVQRKSARDLLDFTLPFRPTRIVEPGCGTGLYTGMLLGAFPDTDLWCIDIAPAMLRAARSKFPFQAHFTAGDAENLSVEQVDLITSNATFQWFDDLDGTLERYSKLLRPGGCLTFSFYGPETYAELNFALHRATAGQHRVRATQFSPKKTIDRLLHRHFKKCHVEERRYEESFSSLKDLLKTIKYTGVRGQSADSSPTWTPHMLAEMRRIYEDKYDEVRATYQVFFCRGQV